MKKVAFAMTIVIILSMLLSGCAAKQASVVPEESKPEGNGNQLKVYTSFYPIYFLTKEIAGDKAEVVCMVPAGAEPHDWEPSPKTIAALQNADLFVYNGAGMETWADTVMQALGKSKIKTVMASEGIELIKPEEHEHEGEEDKDSAEVKEEEHGHGEFDPHVWVSPLRARKQAENIFKALIETDPANKDQYFENYNALASKLNKLDQDFSEAAASFKSNVIVVSHEAFGYLTHDYNLEQIAIRGVNPEEEPSPAKMAELVEECKEHNVKYIFFEKLVSPKLSETLAREVGAQTLVLNDAAGLSDEDIKAGKSYVTVMYDNLENLKKALNEW